MNILKSSYNNFVSVIGSILNTTNNVVNVIQSTGIQNFDVTQSYPAGATIKNPNNNILYTLLVSYVANTGGVDWNDITVVVPYGQNTSAAGTWAPIDNSGYGASITFSNSTYSTSGNIINFKTDVEYTAGYQGTASIAGLPYSVPSMQWADNCIRSDNVALFTQIVDDTLIFLNANQTPITVANMIGKSFTISGTYQLS